MLSFIACAERRPSFNAVEIQTLDAIYRRAESHVRSSLRQVGRLKQALSVIELPGSWSYALISLSLSGLTAIFPDESRLAGTRMFTFWI